MIQYPLGGTQQKREQAGFQQPCSAPTEKLRQHGQASHTCSPGQVDPPKGQPSPEPEDCGVPFNTGARLILQHVQALLVKRFHHAVRSRKEFVAQVSTVTRLGMIQFSPGCACRGGEESMVLILSFHLLRKVCGVGVGRSDTSQYTFLSFHQIYFFLGKPLF